MSNLLQMGVGQHASSSKMFPHGDGPYRSAKVGVKRDLMGHTVTLVIEDLVSGVTEDLLKFLETNLGLSPEISDQS